MTKLPLIFTTAADRYEDGSWSWNDGTEPETETCRCLFLAICGAAAELRQYGLAYDAVLVMVRHLGQPIGPWNNSNGRTMADVIASLRACAEKYEHRLEPA